MSRQFETKLEINASPEEVWKVLTEAQGIQSWFAPSASVTPGEGGSVTISWGPGMEGTSRIEVWKPGEAFRYAVDRPNGEPNAIDFFIESKDGAHTTLRLVNSGFGSDASFDSEVESTSHAWPLFMLLLKEAAERGYQKCQNVTVFKTLTTPKAEAWTGITAKEIPGKVLHFDPFGNGCWETPGRLTSIFCESCGSATMLTIMCFLYDADETTTARAREETEALGSRVS